MQPDSLLVYEILCHALTPFLLLGTARFWKWLTGRQGPAYLLTVITLLIVRVCWGLGGYLIINKLYFGSYNILSVLPSPLRLLQLLAIYCGVYLLVSLALFSEASEKPEKKEGPWRILPLEKTAAARAVGHSIPLSSYPYGFSRNPQAPRNAVPRGLWVIFMQFYTNG